MTEEFVTKKIINWLVENNWKIVCFDFPQSGTGVFLHPNNSTDKNKGTINPDIVAVKDKKCVFFENKSYFCFSDFEKINELKRFNNYSNDIKSLLKNYDVGEIYYGIGYPQSVHKKRAKESLKYVDFIIGVTEDCMIKIIYSAKPDIF